MRINKSIVCVIIFSLMLCMFGCKSKTANGFETSEYSSDIDVIRQYFAELNSIEAVKFKIRQIGDGRIGPSSAGIVGFICVSESERDEILQAFDFAEAEIDFPNGIEPEVTGFDKFKWGKNRDFERKLLKGNMAGEIFFDTINGIVYVNAETT